MRAGIIPKCIEVLEAACAGATEDQEQPGTLLQLLQAIKPSEPADVSLELLTNATCRKEHAVEVLDMGLLKLPLLQMALDWGDIGKKKKLLAVEEV